eukprot:190153-Pyramimonas_sp.AAC.1
MAAVPPGQMHLGPVRGAVMFVPTASLLGPLSGRALAAPPALGLRGCRFPALPLQGAPVVPLRVGGR